jgi:hypothetical protein
MDADAVGSGLIQESADGDGPTLGSVKSNVLATLVVAIERDRDRRRHTAADTPIKEAAIVAAM